MIKRISILLLSATIAVAQTSNVETVRAWTRTHVMGVEGGTLRDPTGTIAEGQRAAAVAAALVSGSNIVAAAAVGLTNALERLWDAADRTNDFTGRLYLAADAEDDPDYENLEAFVVNEISGSNAVTYFTHYTRLLTEAPKTLWAFNPAPGATYWSPGSIDTNAALTNILGYACYEITVPRPAGIGNELLRTHKFLKWGTTDTPLDIPDAGLELVSGGETNAPFTGSVTYTNGSVESVEEYLSGFFYRVTTNEVPQ